eukprot:TRINITY_DN8790_c0_g1_i2.p1 TRINITY_DN8790_c0_g1~~TRINITY_DN8790_c0_g1_i2.p1  ORF type:complete len:972 (+),score=180.55 TRINITY_DN8790_c0_g1_i2:54-2969(+)
MVVTRDLQVSVLSGGKRLPVGYCGNTTPFRTECFEGSLWFTHRPPAGSTAPWAYRERLEGRGSPDWLWEVQLHGKFLRQPRGPVWLRAELRDAPMQLGLVSRALCRAILKFAKMMAQRRGGEILYAFGDEGAGSCPAISVPMLLMDRIFVSDEPHDLPVGEESKGTWRRRGGGQWESIDRAEVKIDTQSYFTAVLATSFIDWARWQLASIPGLGTLALETFWGDQGAWIGLCDVPPDGSPKGWFVEVNLEVTKVTEKPAPPESVYTSDYIGIEEEVVPDREEPDDPHHCRGSSDEEGLELDHPHARIITPFEDMDEDDLSAEVPLERESLLRKAPASGYEEQAAGSSIPSAAQVARVRQIELSVDAPDSGPLRNSLAGDIALDEGDEDMHVMTAGMQLSDNRGGSRQTMPTSPSSRGRPRSSSGSCSVELPWYLRTNGGRLWWCISVEGRPLCWRRDHQLSALCEALAPGQYRAPKASSGIQDLEMARRRAVRLLREVDLSMVEEFTRVEVSLESLLGSTAEGWLGVVDCEGRIVERKVQVGEATLRWPVLGDSELSLAFKTLSDLTPAQARTMFAEEVTIDLGSASFARRMIAGAHAVVVSTAEKQFAFLVRSAEDAQQWLALLQRPDQRSGGVQHASAGAGSSWTDRLPGRMQSALLEGASLPGRMQSALLDRSAWADQLRRWPSNRVVCNDTELCLAGGSSSSLSTALQDPLALSARIMRLAVGAQGAGQDALQQLNSVSCGLKGLNLSGLSAQDLWGFWVNVYHALLIHSCLKFGRPRSLRHLLGFYNNCSYVVCGHIFSLAEIEHCVLRAHMTRPSLRILNLLVRVWRRTDTELEDRPSLNAPANAASSFKCRPDWRLNLVLSAGNVSGSDRLPVFESMAENQFDALVARAMAHTLRTAGRLDKPVQLPYVLYRFRGDAPGPSSEGHDRRWMAALAPVLGSGAASDGRVAYRTTYRWKMRDRLDLL